MQMSDFTVFAYPVALHLDEDGRYWVECRDFPELATDGADVDEALRNAADAIDVVIRERLRQGEGIPEPSGKQPGEYVACPEHLTAYRTVLTRWVQETGRGAQSELARRIGKGETHVRRLLSPDGGGSIKSFVEALQAIGYSAAPSLALTRSGRLVGTPGEPRPHNAASVRNSA